MGFREGFRSEMRLDKPRKKKKPAKLSPLEIAKLKSFIERL